jgi:hypothetical protein
MGRTNVEQRLKREIAEKNELSRELRRRLSKIAKYRRQGAEAGSTRWRKRYGSTAERLGFGTVKMAERVVEWGKELEKKIREEMKISEQELKDFEARYEKELSEYRAAYEKAKAAKKGAQTALAEWEVAEHAFHNATAEDWKKYEAAVAEAAKARAQETKEKKDAEKALQEIESEKRDKTLFLLELERIAAERRAFKK